MKIYFLIVSLFATIGASYFLLDYPYLIGIVGFGIALGYRNEIDQRKGDKTESTKSEQLSQYLIHYLDSLSASQRMAIVTTMVNKFPPNCKPSTISVSTDSAMITMSSPCLTGEQLKSISDSTFQSKNIPVAQIKQIDLNGNQIL